MAIKKKLIETAYKKFKSHIYNDNTLLHARMQLAEFESDQDFNVNLSELRKAINKCTTNNIEPIMPYLERIKYIVMPKKISPSKDIPNVYLNKKELPEYNIEDFNAFIKCPIEIHLISVLWILEIGHKMDDELDNNIHGYRLARNEDGNIEKDSFKLFEKYHERYMQFRDGALKKAISLHNEGLDTTIINLDVKSFFYNINFKFQKECEEFSDTKQYALILNKIMDKVHDTYKKVLIENSIKTKKEAKTIIPIGLLSSSIVANYVLKDFDQEIVDIVKPAFYSRYVDDMLIVLTNTRVKEQDTLKVLLKSCIFKSLSFEFEKMKKKKCKDAELAIHFYVDKKGKKYKNKFTFQNSKIKIFHFYKTDSTHLLEKFSKTITQNSSLFKLLPEDKDIFNTLEEASYNISYSSTINKISSMNGNSLDVLNISRNLVQMTKVVINTRFSQDEIKEYNKQLNNIFVGRNILELQRLWEKIFTYLFVSNSKTMFLELFKRVLHVIFNIKYHPNDEIGKQLSGHTTIYLFNSIAMAISLSPNDFKNTFLQKIKNINSKNFISEIVEEYTDKKIIPAAHELRKANLIRHYMISSIPLINYCQTNSKIVPYNKNSIFIKKCDFEFDETKRQFSPRFIHYHEIAIFYHLKYLHKAMNTLDEDKYLSDTEKFIFETYKWINHGAVKKEFYPKNLKKTKYKYYHDISKLKKDNKLNIALVNMNVSVTNSINSFLGKPNLEFKRLLDVFEVLNNAKKSHCDMVVFPEISIPYSWLKQISDFSKLNDIAIIFGMEHFSISRKVYNYSVAVLPFKDNKYTNAFIHFNLKNHYSPHEIQEIKGHKYYVPKSKHTHIDIYRWKNAVFSIFNCYELTNIQARGLLVGENDFTIAIEYNSDTNYFSNIVGSIARDNHSYIVQVNSSAYGDSRITQPTKTERMDIVKIKGGRGTSFISGTINIKELREFQKLSHAKQMKINAYKLTPPNFKISKFRK